MTSETSQQPQLNPPPYHFEEDTISLMGILLILAKNLKLIIITPTIFCIITIIYALFYTSPSYVSSAKFMSSGSGGEKSQMMGLAAQFGFSTLSSSGPLWSYMDVIKSRTMARTILYRKFDTEKFELQKTLLQILTYGDEDPVVDMDKLIKEGISAVQAMIEIKTSGNMYELEISASEPQLAADIVNTVMDELDKHQREYNARKITQTREFIEERLLDTKSELENTEESLKIFRESNRNITSSPALQLQQERLARDVAVLIGVFTTLKQQLETAKIEEVKESDYVVILDPPETSIHPTKPNKKLMVILSGILGIILSIVLAFILEYPQTIDNEEQKKMEKVKSLIIKNMFDLLPSIIKKRYPTY